MESIGWETAEPTRTVSSTPTLQCIPANIFLSSQAAIAQHTPLAQANLLSLDSDTAVDFHLPSLIQELLAFQGGGKPSGQASFCWKITHCEARSWATPRNPSPLHSWEAQAPSILRLTLSLFILPLLLLVSCIDSGLLVKRLAF
jgi:hypothetical protein